MTCYHRLQDAIDNRSYRELILANHPSEGRRFYCVDQRQANDFCHRYHYVHEVLGDSGRLVFDLDLPATDIPMDTIIHVLEDLFTRIFNRHLGVDKMPPFYWAYRRSDSKTSLHLTLPFWVDNRVEAYMIIYALINDAAKDDPSLSWVGGNLVDTNIANRNASLRLPGMQKPEGGKELHMYHNDYTLYMSRIEKDNIVLTVDANTLPVPTDRRISRIKPGTLHRRLLAVCPNMEGTVGTHSPTCDNDMGVHITTADGKYLLFMQYGNRIQLEGQGIPIIVDII